MPEEVQKEAPPSYASAQADAVPSYWDTTVHAPTYGLDGEMIVDHLPTGSVFSFVWNLLVSVSFQFVGFLLTYLLHTTHAAKYGSRAGLGLTLIQFGFYSHNASPIEWGEVPEGTNMPVGTELSNTEDEVAGSISGFAQNANDWLSFMLMTIGWFLLLSSCLGYFRVKRWERSIRSASPEEPLSPEAIARDRAVRENIERVFGYGLFDEDVADDSIRRQELSPEAIAEETRLARDLRATGLL